MGDPEGRSGFKKILVPCDGSELSKSAARYAGHLARSFGGDIILLHVAEAPYDYEYYGLRPETIRHIREDASAAIEEMLKAAESECGEGVSARHLTAEGQPYERIVETAERENVDLIVLGTHGYGPLRSLMLGSTAEKVVRLAGCSVMTVREGCDPPAEAE